MNPIIVPAIVALLQKLFDKFFPGGAAKAAEPSTVIGLAELTAVAGAACAHLGLAPEWAEPVSLLLLGAAGVVNVWRRERGRAD